MLWYSLIDFFLYFSKYDKNAIFIFYKIHMKILELSRMHTDKNIFLYFFSNKKFHIFYVFMKFWRKNRYI